MGAAKYKAACVITKSEAVLERIQHLEGDRTFRGLGVSAAAAAGLQVTSLWLGAISPEATCITGA